MMDDWAFSDTFGREILLKHFGTKSLKGFGIEKMDCAIAAAGAVMQYLKDTEHNQTDHISRISRIQNDTYVWLDRFTSRNLEILSSPHVDATTLLDVMDHTLSPMGARMMKRWLMLPLKDVKAINERLSAVKYFLGEEEKSEEIRRYISSVSDIERLAGKVATARINPKELMALCRGLDVSTPIKNILSYSENAHLLKLTSSLDSCEELCGLIRRTLCEDAPSLLSKGGVIAEGVDSSLDSLREILQNDKTILNNIIEHESARTGIPSLKISFNNVFGYYIEVRNSHKDKVPAEWIRKQTTVSAERYITPELKEFEAKILGAEEKISQLESSIYGALVEKTAKYITAIQDNAQVIS
jgi:DNA mismatch repair protein MutS